MLRSKIVSIILFFLFAKFKILLIKIIINLKTTDAYEFFSIIFFMNGENITNTIFKFYNISNKL